MEMGWRFKPSSWGLRFALEAATIIRNSLSCLKHIKKFSAIAHKENISSKKLMIKLGMSYRYDSILENPLLGPVECV
jgi:RimJ/RimL family protein N-acetyltransferase